ncbi:MAG: PRC-barrel domain-containing protein [Aurantimonas endophytica]|uniref:PRC-barrel domain-containing protein n=1 Tax=Aurantimonas endophytica TaxID=1522175 RepID=UPI0030020463
MPFAAFAQGTTAPATTETPSMSDESAPAQSMEPAASPDAGGSTTDSTTTATDTVTPPAGDASDTAETPDMDTDTDTAATPGMDTGSDMASTSAGEGPFVTVEPTGAWRASDLEGKDVYDTTGENIGSISDVLLSEQGEVMAVLVGVGGFLGIGEKDVAVSMDALEFGPGKTEGLPTEAEAEATADAAAPAAGGMAADPAAPAGGAETTASTAEPVTPVVGEDNLPDRIVLNVTREELENAPAYGEADDGTDDAAATGSAATTPATDTGMAPASEPAAQ